MLMFSIHSIQYLLFLQYSRDRLVDIGFLGRWWLMERSMREYDINPAEWDEQGKPTNPIKL